MPDVVPAEPRVSDPVGLISSTPGIITRVLSRFVASAFPVKRLERRTDSLTLSSVPNVIISSR